MEDKQLVAESKPPEAKATEQQMPAPESIRPRGAKEKLFDYLTGAAQQINIGHLLLLLLGLHLLAIAFPSGSTDYVFDECYYIGSSGTCNNHFAQDLLNGIASNLEHPFFGKIPAALGIYLFGNDWFGWRIFYVVFGLGSVWALYELARNFFSKEKALFAASFLGFETLFFVHTSLALLEGPPIFFALIGYLAYFKKHYYWAAIALGLSILSKEWGIYFAGGLFLYHVWATKKVPLTELFSRKSTKKLVMFIVVLALTVSIPLYAYDAVYQPYEHTNVLVQTQVIVNSANNSSTTSTSTSTSHSGPVSYPWDNFAYYFSYHTSLTCSGDCLTNPWENHAYNWILPFGISPMGYYVQTVTVQTTSNGVVIATKTLHPVDWQGMGNLVIWYSIWIIVPVIIAKAFTRGIKPLDALIGTWLFATYGPSLLLSEYFHRVVYAFYFINVDPGLALGIPMVVGYIASDSPKLQRLLLFVWLAASVIFFILFFPVRPLDFG